MNGPVRSTTVRVVVASAIMFAAICGCGGGGKHESADVRSGARPLVIYLRGMFDANTPDEATTDRVRERFRAAGFDVWAPTGRVGLCDWSEEAKRLLCWPSDERALAAAREIVHEWGPQLVTRRPVVVGFSNGGAFATLLATHGLVRACGFATLHGFQAGRLHIEPSARPPLLLIAGRGAPWEGPQLAATTAQLSAIGWPHEAKIHDGPHAVSDADLNAAIAFAREATRAGCAETPTSEQQSGATSPPASASAAPSSNGSDASVPSVEADAGIAPLPWPHANACTFPPVSPAEGATARQCCNPAPSVRICLETKSLVHHHTVGPYTERTVTVTPISAEQAAWSFPLDRQQHGSMKYPDVVMARLSFRVHEGGLELRVRAGCENVCRAEGCGKEQKLLASICMAAGQYRWAGERLVRE